MKTILKILAGIQALSAVIGFLSLLGSNWLLAIIELALGLAGVVLYLAVLQNMESVEELQIEVSHLRGKVHRLEKDAYAYSEIQSPLTPLKETAQKPWTCPKCGSVNKAETSACDTCGARYSSWNPS